MTSGRRVTGLLLSALVLTLAGVAISHSLHREPGAARSPYMPGPHLRPSAVPHQSPSHRILLGTYASLSGWKGGEAAIDGREASMGRHYDLQLTYYDWTDPFPDFGEATIAAQGRTPVMTWYGPGKNPNDHSTLAQINNGQEDGWIMRQAEAIKKWSRPVYLRLMIEMNADWYRGYSGHPAAFIAAWRRTHGIFVRAGVHNVSWVWCPNLSPDNWDRYYPGNAYVDVIGVDGYNNVDEGPWRSFAKMFTPFLGHFAGRKPLMIGETGTNSISGRAGPFIAGMHSYLRNVAGPGYGVMALCWFDTDNSDAYNWRVDQTPAAWRAWLALARDPYFTENGPS